MIMSRGLMALASFDKVQAWMKAHDELSAGAFSCPDSHFHDRPDTETWLICAGMQTSC